MPTAPLWLQLINKVSENRENFKRTLFGRMSFQNQTLCFWVDQWPNCTQKVVIECLKPVGDYSLFSKCKHWFFRMFPKQPKENVLCFYPVRIITFSLKRLYYWNKCKGKVNASIWSWIKTCVKWDIKGDGGGSLQVYWWAFVWGSILIVIKNQLQ